MRGDAGQETGGFAYDDRVKLWKRDRVRQTLREAWRRLRGGELGPERAAASVAVGLLVGFVPLYGVQTFICFLFTFPLRLDFPLAWAATNIANPITIGFILVLDIELGGWLARGAWVNISTHDLKVSNLGPFLLQGLLGGAAAGAVAGAAGGLLTLWWLRRAARALAQKKEAHSTARTPST
jgi:uncharacterized protein (DUF2062 family)